MMARKSDPDHDRIAKKAHELWEAEGRPHGRDQDHWDQAREMVAVEDSQRATLRPRNAGAEEPVEEPAEALRNLADFPNLTDQGENLLTSTDREPDLVATPAGRKGRMPKAEVPISDQPGVPPKGRKAAAKPAGKASVPKSADADATPPKTADVPREAKPAAGKTASAKPEAAKAGSAGADTKPKRGRKPA
jgi:hypothetical protein